MKAAKTTVIVVLTLVALFFAFTFIVVGINAFSDYDRCVGTDGDNSAHCIQVRKTLMEN